MSRVSFANAEIADHGDFENIGVFTQEQIDRLWGDAIGYPAHWAAFTVSQKSAQVVTVSPGRYIDGDTVYEQDDDVDLTLQIYIPPAASDQRWAAILLRGQEVTVNENRSFETSEDPKTSIPVQRSTPKTVKRVVTLTVQGGDANPIPVKPVVAETDACIAYVLLTSSGIETIEPGNVTRAKTLYEVEGRVSSLEVGIEGITLRTESIETQITNIKGKLTEIPRPAVIRQMQRDIGATRLLLDLPDEARAYLFDNALLQDAWDKEHVDWLARIEEGVRFGFAAISTARLEVQAEDNPEIKFSGRRLVPAYSEVTKIGNTSLDGTLNISQLVHTETTLVKKEVSRVRVTYGPTVAHCENAAGWAALHGKQAGEMLTIDGETFVVDGVIGNEGIEGHEIFGLRQIRYETYTEPYWEYETSEVGVNGSIYGQTFLVAQPLQATSIDLSFSRVGVDGDVHLFLVETTKAGTPRWDAVLAQSTIARNNLVVGWNRFSLPITLLESGRRYAFVTVTTGAHAVHVSTGNKYGGGSRFFTTDGAFAQGSTTEDFCFRVNGASYAAARTVVPMAPLTLADGMTQIDMLFPGWVPGGCQIGWEIRPIGSATWTELDDGNPETNPLIGLPPSVELRMVLLGTSDLQPMIQLDEKAVSRVARNRSTMVAVSVAADFGISSDSIVTQYTVDSFDEDHHTFTPAIMVGASTVDPDTTSVTIDANKPSRRTYLSTYTLGATTTSARMRLEAGTDNVVTVPFVQDVFISAL